MTSKVYEIADRSMSGRLALLLTRWQAEGLNRDAMAEKLQHEHGINVTGRTVDRWLAALRGSKAMAS